MSALNEKIGLFPLGLVLFPGSFYPLHIFEEKYKLLVATCLTEQMYFGINLVSGNKMYNVGCTAKIAKVLVTFDDGRMDIMVVGGRRFALNSIEEKEKPYVIANVEYFDDDDTSPVDGILFEECVEMYNKVIEVVYKDEGGIFLQHTYSGETNLSFLMAQKAGLSSEQKQSLLEMKSENQRLAFLHSHLDLILPKITQQEQIQKIIMTDGYFRA